MSIPERVSRRSGVDESRSRSFHDTWPRSSFLGRFSPAERLRDRPFVNRWFHRAASEHRELDFPAMDGSRGRSARSRIRETGNEEKGRGACARGRRVTGADGMQRDGRRKKWRNSHFSWLPTWSTWPRWIRAVGSVTSEFTYLARAARATALPKNTAIPGEEGKNSSSTATEDDDESRVPCASGGSLARVDRADVHAISLPAETRTDRSRTAAPFPVLRHFSKFAHPDTRNPTGANHGVRRIPARTRRSSRFACARYRFAARLISAARQLAPIRRPRRSTTT